MKDGIRLGVGRFILDLPPRLVNMKKKLAENRKKYESAMDFMTDDHRRVHHFTVRELPAAGIPLDPGMIAAGTSLPQERVVSLLDDLEKHMTFLFRNREGHVSWAYPVSVDKTPHRLAFDTGEQVYAA